VPFGAFFDGMMLGSLPFSPTLLPALFSGCRFTRLLWPRADDMILSVQSRVCTLPSTSGSAEYLKNKTSIVKHGTKGNGNGRGRNFCLTGSSATAWGWTQRNSFCITRTWKCLKTLVLEGFI
jgi:hypothetical protein